MNSGPTISVYATFYQNRRNVESFVKNLTDFSKNATYVVCKVAIYNFKLV